MDKTITTANGGLPWTWNTLRQILGQNGTANHGLYEALNNHLRPRPAIAQRDSHRH